MAIEPTSIIRRVMRLGLPALLVAAVSPALAHVAAIDVASAAQGEASASPIGDWTTIDDESGKARSIVRIYEHEGKLRGRIVKLFENPDAVCDKCTGRNKGRPVLGMIVMWDLEREDEDEDEWSGGHVFDPEKGEGYRAKIWLEDENTLKVRGYAGPFFRTQTWHRQTTR